MKDISVYLLTAGLLLYVVDIAYRRFRFRIFPSSVKNKAPEANNAPVQQAVLKTTDKKEAALPAEQPSKKKKKENDKDILDTSKLLNRMNSDK